MALLQDVVAYCDQRLDVSQFKDYCPNGLQVEASAHVHKVVSGVTASLALIEAAIAQQADLLLVHHGYFWKGEAAPLVGMKGRRIQRLMSTNISLLAYHLPLDTHLELGNNVCMGQRLGFSGQPIADKSLVWGADLRQPFSAQAMSQLLDAKLHQWPTVIDVQSSIQRVAWCTGAAQGYITEAAEAGFDAFISGEISEQTGHQARELGISYFAAGHHATEKYGVQALGDDLASYFNVEHVFIDIDNPA